MAQVKCKLNQMRWPIEVTLNGHVCNISPEEAQELADQLAKAAAETELTEFEKKVVDAVCHCSQSICDRATLVEAAEILLEAAKEELEKTCDLIPKDSIHQPSFDKGKNATKWRPSPEQVEALKEAVNYCSFGEGLFTHMRDLRDLLYEFQK